MKYCGSSGRTNQKEYEYATDIAFEDACDVVVELMDEINVTKVSEEF